MTKDVDALASRLRARGLLELVDKIANEHHVTRDEVLGTRRLGMIVEARKVLYVELRAMGFSYPEIGRLTARDHTTVMAGVRAVGGDPKPRPTLAKTSWRARCVCGQRFEDHMSKAPHDLPITGCAGFVRAVPALAVGAALTKVSA